MLTWNKHERVNLFMSVWYFTAILWIDIFNSCCVVNCPNELFGIMGNTSISHFDAPGINGLIIKNAQGSSLVKIITNTHATINRKEKTLSAKTSFSQIQAFGSRTNGHADWNNPWNHLVIEKKNAGPLFCCLYHIASCEFMRWIIEAI